MLVLSLVIIGSLLHCAFAVLATLVARRLPVHAGSQRHAWQMVAFVYVLFAASHLSQMVFATSAFVAGPRSGVFQAYMVYLPISNHSRTLVVWGLYLLLAVLALRGAESWRVLRRVYVPVAVGMLVLGGVIGGVEGTFNLVRHLTNTSVMDAVGFLGATTVLFLTMLRGTIDRALWFAIFLYASSSVMSSLFIAALTSMGTGAWTPPPWVLEASRIAFSSAMVGMAVWRLRLARRGVSLPGLLGPERHRPVMA